MRCLALGDSYTIGEGVAPFERWPMQLATRLRRAKFEIEEPHIIATTGWTTDELSAAMDAEDIDTVAAKAPFDWVSLLIGVNNQYRGRTIENYRDEFRALLLRAIGLSGNRRTRVFVVSIPDWGVTPFAKTSGRDTRQIARELNAFNAAAKSICKSFGVRFIDIAGISRDRGAHPRMLASDGLHPGARMYARWADKIAVELQHTTIHKGF